MTPVNQIQHLRATASDGPSFRFPGVNSKASCYKAGRAVEAGVHKAGCSRDSRALGWQYRASRHSRGWRTQASWYEASLILHIMDHQFNYDLAAWKVHQADILAKSYRTKSTMHWVEYAETAIEYPGPTSAIDVTVRWLGGYWADVLTSGC